MTIDELRKAIEEATGVPASLLTGETADENISQAKTLMAYKRESEAQQSASPREQFEAWILANSGIEPADAAGAALADLQEEISSAAGRYPAVKDGGNPYINGRTAPDPRPAREQFTEWARQVLTEK